MENTQLETLDSADIMRLMTLLPHRYPFLMIDKIININGDESATGVKCVTINEPHFQGHFPERPVMPGVLLIEAMAQTAGAICVANGGVSGKPKFVYFMTIDKCKFRKPVEPGDVVYFNVRKDRQRRNIWRFAAEAIVDGAKVAEAEVSAMLVSEDDM